MPTDNPKAAKFPLLETLLAHRGLPLKAAYKLQDVAAMFDVTIRTIQQRVKSGELPSRNLPGRAKFLSIDLEEFLSRSPRKATPASL